MSGGPDFTLLHHKRLFRDGNPEENKPTPGSCLSRLHHRNPRHVPELWWCAGRRLPAALMGALPVIRPAETGGRAVMVRGMMVSCCQQTFLDPHSALRVSEAPGCFAVPAPRARLVWTFQPAPWAVPAIACPTACLAQAALPWPPWLPPESSWVGNPAAFSVVQEAQDRAGITSLSAEGRAIFFFFLNSFFIILVKIIWHGATLS